jgi:HCOMODA/2-hydroxy-3-carboxy-muconic semialdehyde decarboxylase
VTIDSKGYSFYLERFIHGEIYKARPDVQAVVHNHSPTVISFGIGSTPLRPVFHQAAFFLDGVPIWDYRDFGTADGALVDTPERGRGLAVALADRPVVLMRNHGVAVVASSLPMVAGRSITLEQNAEMQSQALARGDEVTYLELEKETLGSTFDRAWDLWKRQLSSEGR